MRMGMMGPRGRRSPSEFSHRTLSSSSSSSNCCSHEFIEPKCGGGRPEGQDGKSGSWSCGEGRGGQAHGAQKAKRNTYGEPGHEFCSCGNRWRSPSPGICETDLTFGSPVAPSAKRLGGGACGGAEWGRGSPGRGGGGEGLAGAKHRIVSLLALTERSSTFVLFA